MSELSQDDHQATLPSEPEDQELDDARKISRLIERIESGESGAFDQLIPLVYSQLRSVASRLRRRENLGSPTWNTTAVVNEAYLKLARAHRRFGDRLHFFAVASTAMRQLLVDEARKRSSQKRGSGRRPISLEALGETAIEDQRFFLLELDTAINQIAATNPRLARVIEYRYFGGMTEAETAEVLGCSVRTVRRDWTVARARLGVHFSAAQTS